MTVATLQDYSRAVQVFTTQAVESSGNDTLDEKVRMFTESDPKFDGWVLLIGHTLLHCGEIAALKGVYGGKGLPF